MSMKGEDDSVWQPTTGVDDAPDFVILRATLGNDYVDPDCDNKYQRAKSEGKLLGVYHFAKMGDPTIEADWFVNNVLGYIGEAILVLDYETNTNVTWALTWLNRVKERTGVKPLIYMSASTIKAADWSHVVEADYGLWVAGYPAKYDVSNPAWTDGSDMPYDISPWPFAAIWQFTSSAGTEDLDEANMTPDAWHRYAAVTPLAPTQTPPATVPDPVTPPGDGGNSDTTTPTEPAAPAEGDTSTPTPATQNPAPDTGTTTPLEPGTPAPTPASSGETTGAQVPPVKAPTKIVNNLLEIIVKNQTVLTVLRHLPVVAIVVVAVLNTLVDQNVLHLSDTLVSTVNVVLGLVGVSAHVRNHRAA